MPLSLAAIHALINDNASGDISAEDVRDAVEALYDWIPRQDKYLVGRLADETPHADDVFFAGGTPGGTELTVSGTALWDQEDGALSVIFNDQVATDAAVRLYPLTTVAPPVTIETCVETLLITSAIPHFGVCLTDGVIGTSNVAVTLFVIPNDLYVYRGVLNNFAGTGSAAAADVSLVPGRFYMRIIWVSANNFKAQWSPSGAAGSWTTFGLGNQALTMTPTRFGPLVSGWGDSALNVATYRYLRVYDADLSA